MSLEDYVFFFLDSAVYTAKTIREFLCPKTYTFDDYYEACKENDVKTVEKIFKKDYTFDRNLGLKIACIAGYLELAKLILKEENVDVNTGLEFACKNNRYDLAELMVQNNADIKIGLRNCSSKNIERMLNRYRDEPKGEEQYTRK